jgi:hypothetical protein
LESFGAIYVHGFDSFLSIFFCGNYKLEISVANFLIPTDYIRIIAIKIKLSLLSSSSPHALLAYPMHHYGNKNMYNKDLVHKVLSFLV